MKKKTFINFFVGGVGIVLSIYITIAGISTLGEIVFLLTFLFAYFILTMSFVKRIISDFKTIWQATGE